MSNKIFVGTLYSGEGDYLKCSQAIAKQSGVNVKHHLISNLPELEAHNKLWDDWDLIKNKYDLFVKIDADTVLAHDTVLQEICKLFVEQPRLTGVQCYLYDYFTDGLIYGLNCFSPKVQFTKLNDKLYCDRADTNHDIVLRGNTLPNSLNPAGYHCYHSSDIQAFHYGVHRALKNQTQIFKSVKQAWVKEQDRLRGLAIEGFNMAYLFQTNKSFNYDDDEFKIAFDIAVQNYEKFNS